MELTLTADHNEEVGDIYTVVGKATDGDGTIYFTGMTWGDGASEPRQSSPRKCKSYPPLTSPPGPYQPDPDSKTYTFNHRYLAPGDYKITFRVASLNADCRPNGPKDETRVLSVTVTVKPKTP